MNILHYSLGFPPYRSGGLTKFCMDLMEEQKKKGNKVALLWPGEMKIISETRIKDHGQVGGIRNFEIVNPTPVSYDEGIQKFDLFQKKGDLKCYQDFLEKYQPDVIHVHTLMGLHENFLVAAKNKKIRLIFTAHDFFPICPKVTMFRDNQLCDCVKKCSKCTSCNQTALPIWKVNLLQSKVYRKFKNSIIIKKLRKKHRDNYLSISREESTKVYDENPKDYLKLRAFYKRLLEYMDLIHYNSNITKRVYDEFLGYFPSKIIFITHKDIRDNRKIKKFEASKIRLTYLGPYGGAKGFFLLKRSLDEVWEERKDFCLNIFFEMDEKPPYTIEHGRYTYNQLEEIFDNTDVLIVPSIWYETFGYTVVEALSFGVPVIVTKNVGAKDIIPAGGGIIVDDISIDGIKKVIINLSIDKLREMNAAIMKSKSPTNINEMENIIYYELYC